LRRRRRLSKSWLLHRLHLLHLLWLLLDLLLLNWL